MIINMDEEITEEEYIAAFQDLINTGIAWQLEGSVGRESMALIESGKCTVGTESYLDHWGNRIPAISDLEPGTKGTPEFVKGKRDRI